MAVGGGEERPSAGSGPQWPRILRTSRTLLVASATRRSAIMNSLVFLLSSLLLIAYTNTQDSCSTPRGEAGSCINIRVCPPLLEILRTQRQQPGAAEFLRRSVCGYENLDPKVCCPGGTPAPPTVAPNPPPSPPPRTPPPTPNVAGPLPVPGDCGFSNTSHTRVVNGIESKIGAWPWMVALGYRPSPRSNSKDPRFLCGASLITTQHVLTAAHCVYNRQDLYFVRLGEHDLQSDVNDSPPIDVPIKERKVHGGYTSSSYVNDIAILVLERSITPTPRVHPICLPVIPEVRQRNYVRSTPFVAGWGAIRFSGPSSTKLMEIQIPVVSQEECKKSYATFKTAIIDERVLCAGYASGEKDACQGDSGGPLMAPHTDGVTYFQIGVVSYGYRCAEPNKPGVYTSTSHFLDWIIDNVK